MTKWQRIKTIFGALVSLLLAPLLLIDAELGCVVIVMLLGLAAALRGIRMLCCYAAMARHMVGGKLMLYQGIILLDFGLFTLGLADIPSKFIMLYLLFGHLFFGLVGVLRALEIRKRKIGSWRFKLLVAAGNITLGVLCLVELNSMGWADAMYCVSVIWSALGRLASACRPNQKAYVELP